MRGAMMTASTASWSNTTTHQFCGPGIPFKGMGSFKDSLYKSNRATSFTTLPKKDQSLFSEHGTTDKRSVLELSLICGVGDQIQGLQHTGQVFTVFYKYYIHSVSTSISNFNFLKVEKWNKNLRTYKTIWGQNSFIFCLPHSYLIGKQLKITFNESFHSIQLVLATSVIVN